MSAETVASTIHPFLAPEVLVTACAILVGGLLTHLGPPPYGGIAKAGYAATNDRLSALSRELLYLLPKANACRGFLHPRAPGRN